MFPAVSNIESINIINEPSGSWQALTIVNTKNRPILKNGVCLGLFRLSNVTRQKRARITTLFLPFCAGNPQRKEALEKQASSYLKDQPICRFAFYSYTATAAQSAITGIKNKLSIRYYPAYVWLLHSQIQSG